MKKLTQEELDVILDSHQKWVGTVGDEGACAVFTQLDLSGLGFHSRDLTDAEFEGCNLARAEFVGATCTSAKFKNCDMTMSVFCDATCYQCEFDGCTLVGAAFDDADLTRATLDHCHARGASFARAKMTRAWIGNSELTFVALNRAEMNDVSIRNVDYTGARFDSASLRHACLWDVVFKDTSLYDVDAYGLCAKGCAFLHQVDTEASSIRGLDAAVFYRCVSDSKIIRTMHGLRWPVNVWGNTMSIGCQLHAVEEWYSFDDAAISAMHGGALSWWTAHKEVIRQFIDLTKPAE